VEKIVDYFPLISAERPISSLAIYARRLIDNINPFISAQIQGAERPGGLGLREQFFRSGLHAFHNSV
jgi:hypothetical protein